MVTRSRYSGTFSSSARMAHAVVYNRAPGPEPHMNSVR